MGELEDAEKRKIVFQNEERSFTCRNILKRNSKLTIVHSNTRTSI